MQKLPSGKPLRRSQSNGRNLEPPPQLLNSQLLGGAQNVGENAGTASEYELSSLDKSTSNATSGGGQVNKNIVDHGQQSFHMKRTVRDIA